MIEESITRLYRAIISGQEDVARQAAQTALDAGVDPLRLIREGINRALDEIGKAFQQGELYLPELILAGDAAKAASDVITPLISSEARHLAAEVKVVLGTIQGDMHDIGKNIVAAYLAASGVKVIDLGVDVPPKRFMQEAVANDAHVVAMSTLLTTTHPLFRQMMRLLEATGERQKRFVIIGGGPVTPRWAHDIGADGYGRDAKDAVDLCAGLMKGDRKPAESEPLVLGALQ